MKLKNLYRIIIVFLIITNSIFLAMWIFAPEHNNPGNQKEKIITRLQLDDSQIKQYESLINEHRRAIRSCEFRMRKAKELYFKALTAENPEVDTLTLHEMMHLEKEINLIHFSHFKAVKKLLHPNQISAFNDLMQDIARILGPKGLPPR